MNFTDCVTNNVAGNEARPSGTLLGKHAVLRIDRNSPVREIRVLTGILWMTGTPADGDVILRAGEQRKLDGNAPFIIEALETAELFLLPESDDLRRMLFMPLCMWVSIHDPDTAH